MFLSEVPKCPSTLARGRRLVSCLGARGGAAASRAGLGRSRRGGRARSSSPASAGPSSQRGGRGGVVSPADASARPRRGELARRGSGQPTWLVVANRPWGGIACRRPKRGARLLGEKGPIVKFLHNHLQIRTKPGCAMTVHTQRTVRLGEEEEVVEQLLCPEMTRWRWSSTRCRSCASGRGTSGGCAAQNAASLALVWSRIAMPDGATRLGRARGLTARC